MAGETILIADDDADIVRFVEVNLKLAGFEVYAVSDGPSAIAAARELSPDLILLDVMMPGMEGFEVCQTLRADPSLARISIVMLTAKAMAEDRIAGLEKGADDYIVKPFDPGELVARVKSTLRRAREMRALSPLTGLPGNFQISDELARRVSNPDAQWAIVYADLDSFKPFNDKYGFMRGDLAIKYTSTVILGALEEFPDHDNFVGHIGGDDFVVATSQEIVEDFCQLVIERFEADVGQWYDPEDAAAGYIDVKDRRGDARRFNLLSISLGVAWNKYRSITSNFDAVAIAAEMKAYAKRHPRSAYEIDRRRE